MDCFLASFSEFLATTVVLLTAQANDECWYIEGFMFSRKINLILIVLAILQLRVTNEFVVLYESFWVITEKTSEMTAKHRNDPSWLYGRLLNFIH